MNKNRPLKNYFGKYLDLITGISFSVLILSWFYLILVTEKRIQSFDAAAVIRILTLGGGMVAILTAMYKIYKDQKWRQSEAYIENARDLFEKSYAVLGVNEETEELSNDRYNWISSSRLLLAALDLGEKITDRSHKDIYNELTQYWRALFREKINPNQKGPDDKFFYYAEGGLHAWSPHRVRPPISEQTIAVIYRFMSWPEEKGDRLDDIERFSDKEIYSFSFDSKGLYQYCLDKRRINEIDFVRQFHDDKGKGNV